MPHRADETAEQQDGETGGKRSLAGRLKEKAKMPGIKDKVKNLKSKVHIPGTKHSDENSEYDDDNSPRSDSATTPNSDTTYNTGASTPFTTVKTEPVHDTSATPSSQNRSSSDSPKVGDGAGARSRDFGTVAGQYPAPTPPPQRRPPQLSTNNLDQNDDVSSGLDNKFSNFSVGDHAPGSYPRDEPVVNQTSRAYSTLPTKTVDNGNRGDETPLSNSGPAGSYNSASPNYTQNSSQSPATTPKGVTGTLTSMKDSVVGSAAAAATVVGSKLGYYREEDDATPGVMGEAGHNNNRAYRRSMTSPDAGGKTYTQQATDTFTGVKNSVVSSLGLDKPRDPNAPSVLDKAKNTLGMGMGADNNKTNNDKPRDSNAPSIMDRTRGYVSSATVTAKGYSATAADHAARTKDRVAATTAPTHHDKSLAEQVTESLSSLPGTIKDKVWGPASPSKTANGGFNSAGSPQSGSSPRSPGVVSRVSGAVTSLFSSSPKEDLHDQQHTFPAHSDYVKPASGAETSTNFADHSYTADDAATRFPASSTTSPYPVNAN